jgi:hypothetical protein
MFVCSFSMHNTTHMALICISLGLLTVAHKVIGLPCHTTVAPRATKSEVNLTASMAYLSNKRVPVYALPVVLSCIQGVNMLPLN